MLQGLAKQAMQGRWQAALLIAAMSLIAMAIPPVSYLASGIIALTTLRVGPKEGLLVVMMATFAFAIVATLLLKQGVMTGLFLVFSWLPVFGITLVLGYTRSLVVSLLTAAAIGIAMILLTHLVLSDPAAWWLNVLAPFGEMLAAQPDWQMTDAETQSFVSALAGMMTGLIVAGLFLNVVLGLLLGRAWQAGLYNPGGFADEFQQMQLGRLPALVTTILVALAILPGVDIAVVKDSMFILLALFAIQGVAVIHAIVRYGNKHKAWLMAMYILLIIAMPQMATLLALIGVLEQWFNFRQRVIPRDD